MQPLGPNPLAFPAADTALGGDRSGFAFAGYVFDMRRDRLTKDGLAVVLAPKPRALLRYFLSNPERVIDKRELITAVWASTVVNDDSLVQLVLELRNALHFGALFESRARCGPDDCGPTKCGPVHTGHDDERH